MSPRLKAVLQILLVSFLWSTSWVLIKIGLEDMPALTFAGLRYTVAFLCLVPFAFTAKGLGELRGMSARQWAQLGVLAVTLYTVAQGAQFLALVHLPAASVSLVLSFIPVAVAFLGVLVLKEAVTPSQWLGIAIFIAGASTYFYPAAFAAEAALGLVIAVVCVLATAIGSVTGRSLARTATLRPILITAVSMGAGALLLLGTGAGVQGLPPLGLTGWLIVTWLAVVNTAFAFTLYNHALRSLSAAESSVIINTMLIQIAILAWLFLGEALSVREILGLAVAAAGTFTVQIAHRAPRRAAGS